MTDVLILLCTCGTHDEALTIANSLVEARLAACVNVLPPVQSIYRWQGKVETAQEVLSTHQNDTRTISGHQRSHHAIT